MTYHDDLTRDKKRVEIFKNAIKEKVHGLTYDLGTGSGILAKIASEYAREVYAFEINPLTIKKITKKNLENIPNVKLFNIDASTYKFKKQPDVVICEMLDTALIDEEQAIVINNVLKYTKEDTIFIPESTYDTIQLVNTKIAYITYYENNMPEVIAYSNEEIFNETKFSSFIDTTFNKSILIKATKTGYINAIKLTTYTRLTEKLQTGPTPMLNPPLLIPIGNTRVKCGKTFKINLQYEMGGGLNTIKTNIC